jgi:hypothetical protein
MREQSAPSFKLWWLSINTNRDGLLFMIPYRFIPLDKRVILDVKLDALKQFNIILLLVLLARSMLDYYVGQGIYFPELVRRNK